MSSAGPGRFRDFMKDTAPSLIILGTENGPAICVTPNLKPPPLLFPVTVTSCTNYFCASVTKCLITLGRRYLLLFMVPEVSDFHGGEGVAEQSYSHHSGQKAEKKGV